MNGTIFNIQRFSMHDGPGIRTTVFFKGCNLRCAWCHNPESQALRPEMMLRQNKCVGCGACRAVCPDAFTDACRTCTDFRCVAACTHGAREISGYKTDSADVIAQVARDRDFYDTTGGGVTCSGGEPLLQPDFLTEILHGCRALGISTAIETAGDVDWAVWARILPELDLVICDLKAMDAEKHRALTGVRNARILDNARRLMDRGVNVLFRMPIVPGVNDSELDAVVRFVGDHRLELMAYHNICAGKYDALRRPFGTADAVPPTAEQMEAWVRPYPNVFFVKQ